ncbi:RNA/RNP complex-1-interacting phosphatase isoform X1 [Tribolium castaneum]|nr:PREDICTED: RNA/RNP complex-1-interacting phosphatase isoform X1 [Tribolium castaneum]|eukprot:XP_008190299.1 PREDICTED: RNA/RNP complex-1-interacting phosphatase isoform X1 [Tribolium castaneum]
MTKRIPDRWENYLPVGRRVPGTRFLPFKVPLKMELCRRQPESEWFTPGILVENIPKLKAVIDLTNTNRYYNSEEFTSKGILYKKIGVMGRKLPPKEIREEFFDAVDQLCRTLDQDRDALIGVHCTHGLNRTGYLICKYMVLRMKIDPQEAINKFQEARGHEIERHNYVSDILYQPRIWQNERHRSSPLSSQSVSNWRTEPRWTPSYERRHSYKSDRSYGRSLSRTSHRR